ncbi:MAG: response regulator transcription factor [Oscillospiraceae bacterium]|nr:response regulator transcription factor [Oscillospiraceae bacterium]
MSHILIVEDDADINNMAAEALAEAGHRCTQAFSGTEGLLRARQESFDLIVLDLMLPGLSGERLLDKLRELGRVPVIVLSAKDGLDSKVALLEAGAEDYITKPFELKELTARVAVQLRRFSGPSGAAEVLFHRGLRLDSHSHRASMNGKEISFTKQEFQIVELLLSHPGRAFSKQDIYQHAWEEYYIGEDKTINVHISNIRRKLKAVSDEELIETVWGVGFRLAP